MSIIEFVASLFRHNRKTVAEIMLPLTSIHSALDKLSTDAAGAAAEAHAKADALRAEASAHVSVSADADAAKAKLAALVNLI